MPATFAHPAFAWPLRRWLPTLPLVIGTIAPDVAHLLPRRAWTDHTLLSIATFSLPVGLAAWLVLRGGLLAGLSVWWPKRWPPPTTTGGLVTAGSAIALGAATHVGLDHCTHVYGYAVSLWAPLRTTWGPLPLFKWLQYGLGVAGSVFLLVEALRWDAAVARGPFSKAERMGAALVGLGVTGGSFIWARSQTWWMDGFEAIKQFTVQVASGGLVLTALALVLLGVAGQVKLRLSGPGGASSERRSSSDSRMPERRC